MVGELIAERYELKELVGTGGMSTVYCAHDTLLERDVALKLLHEHYTSDDGYVERFRREARAVAQLSHPNIVTVIDRGEQDGRQFIVFEYVDGENLKELVQRVGALPVRQVLDLGVQIGRALAFAHAQNVVHRDVKPQNVLLDADGRARVTDFGIARTVDAGHTETGTVLGTSHYIAPEQARGERVDAQTDVYSFGVVLYELLTGQVPYEGESFVVVAMQHANADVPSVLERRPDAPLRLASAIERAMAKEPADRFPSMDALVDELEACRAELDALPDGERTMIQRSPVLKASRQRRVRAERRRVWPWLAALGALVAAAALGWAVVSALDDGKPGARGGGAQVQLSGIGAFDPPPGDGEEHSDEAGLATDGNASTFWRTENYHDQLSLQKEGVGLVLDAGQPVELSSLTVTTDTPGFTAVVRPGDSPTSFGEPLTEPQTVSGETEFRLEGAEARYWLVWITELTGSGHVNEVKAS